MAWEVLVVGGGAAGLAAAVAAGAGGRRVLVCERQSRPGRKLLVTGGGRCNVTTAVDRESIPAAFGRRGRFVQPALECFGPDAIRAWLAGQGVFTVVEDGGCVFPASQRATDVLDALLRAAARARVEVRCGCEVVALRMRGGVITGVETRGGPLDAATVILAAGGSAYPAAGGTDAGFALARQAGVEVVPPTPALVPLVTAEAWSRELPGLVLPQARVQIEACKGGHGGRCGPVLFTHEGLSGPPVLDLSGEVASRLCDGPVALRLAVRADRDRAAWLALFESWRTSRGGRSMHHLLAAEIPRRLAETLCGLAGLAATAAARAPRARLEALAGLCAGATLTVTATKGWPQAMVTRGGVALDELDPRDLDCRRLPGLRCVGEVVDLDGPCGGYNLTWALASGWLAGSRPP